jgi:hypothetical protein
MSIYVAGSRVWTSTRRTFCAVRTCLPPSPLKFLTGRTPQSPRVANKFTVRVLLVTLPSPAATTSRHKVDGTHGISLPRYALVPICRHFTHPTRIASQMLPDALDASVDTSLSFFPRQCHARTSYVLILLPIFYSKFMSKYSAIHRTVALCHTCNSIARPRTCYRLQFILPALRAEQ